MPSGFGGPPAPLAGHELEVPIRPRPYEDGLQDAVLPDGSGQVLQGLLIEALPGLVGIGADAPDGQMAHLGHGSVLVRAEQVDEGGRVLGPLSRQSLCGLRSEVWPSQVR